MKILSVPFKKQVLSYSCFPACVEMVLNFYGDQLDQKTLYKNSRLPEHEGAWDVKIGPFLIRKGYTITTYWNGRVDGWESVVSNETIKAHREAYKKSAMMGMRHKRNATILTIKKFIDKEVPVLTEIHGGRFYRQKSVWTHMIVVVGYDRDNFYIHDPQGHLKSPNKISIVKFRKCWEKVSDVSGRSMFVIEK